MVFLCGCSLASNSLGCIIASSISYTVQILISLVHPSMIRLIPQVLVEDLIAKMCDSLPYWSIFNLYLCIIRQIESNNKDSVCQTKNYSHFPKKESPFQTPSLWCLLSYSFILKVIILLRFLYSVIYRSDAQIQQEVRQVTDDQRYAQ